MNNFKQTIHRKVHDRPGWVYALYNPAFPTMMKIGRTYREPKYRLLELNSRTCLPNDFKIEHAHKFRDCVVAEKTIHSMLNGYRVKTNREFFNVNKDIMLECFSNVEQMGL